MSHIEATHHTDPHQTHSPRRDTGDADPHRRNPADITLADLVDAVRAGCPGAWREVVLRLDPGLHAIARGYGLDAATADDVVQQTWLGAVTHLSALREPAALPGWLRSILHRECLRSVNRASREVPVVEYRLGETVSPAHVALRAAPPEPPEDEAIRRAQLAALRDAVRRRLSAREQELISLLTDVEELSYVEIARALDLPVGSIGPTRARCIAKLRPLLAG